MSLGFLSSYSLFYFFFGEFLNHFIPCGVAYWRAASGSCVDGILGDGPVVNESARIISSRLAAQELAPSFGVRAVPHTHGTRCLETTHTGAEARPDGVTINGAGTGGMDLMIINSRGGLDYTSLGRALEESEVLVLIGELHCCGERNTVALVTVTDCARQGPPHDVGVVHLEGDLLDPPPIGLAFVDLEDDPLDLLPPLNEGGGAGLLFSPLGLTLGPL